MSEASYQPRELQPMNFVQGLVRVCLFTFLISLGVVVIYPLLWMALNGFKTNSEIFGEPFALPTGFTLDNYISAGTRASGIILQRASSSRWFQRSARF